MDVPREALLPGVVVGGDERRCVRSLHGVIWSQEQKRFHCWDVFSPEAEITAEA